MDQNTSKQAGERTHGVGAKMTMHLDDFGRAIIWYCGAIVRAANPSRTTADIVTELDPAEISGGARVAIYDGAGRRIGLAEVTEIGDSLITGASGVSNYRHGGLTLISATEWADPKN
jgi:hypothetical protein